jgi:hypothetical protein
MGLEQRTCASSSVEKRDLPVGSALIGAVISHTNLGIAAWRQGIGAGSSP